MIPNTALQPTLMAPVRGAMSSLASLGAAERER